MSRQLTLVGAARREAPSPDVPAGRRLAKRRARAERQSRYWAREGGRIGRLADAIAAGDPDRALSLARRLGIVRTDRDRRELLTLRAYVRRTGRRPAALARWALSRPEGFTALATLGDEDAIRPPRPRRRPTAAESKDGPEVMARLLARALGSREGQH